MIKDHDHLQEYLTHYHVLLVNDNPDKPTIQVAGFFVHRQNAERMATAITSEIAHDDVAVVESCIEDDCNPTFHRYYLPVATT